MLLILIYDYVCIVDTILLLYYIVDINFEVFNQIKLLY